MLKLSAKLRQETGGKNKRLRRDGFIPAVLYGAGIKNVNLAIKASEFEKIYQKAGESTLIKLKIVDDPKDTEEKLVLIYDVARDPVKGYIIHADINKVRMDREITAEVPIIFTGESNAVEKESGILVKNMQSVEVKALPQDLPHEIEVDISRIKTFEDNICVKDLELSEKAQPVPDVNEVVVSVIPPPTEEELEELTEAPVENVEDVEVEKTGKEADEQKEEGPAEKTSDEPHNK